MRRWNILLAILAIALFALPAIADEPAAQSPDAAQSQSKLDYYSSFFEPADSEPAFFGGISFERRDAALELAGANRPELERALATFPAGSVRTCCVWFLIENMPLYDLASAKADCITQNVELAIQARSELPFPVYYSDEDWLYFVLPHRVSQEPLEDWRPVLHDALAPLIASCETPEEAWDVVFKWCGGQASFKQTQRRDQGPLTTIKGGCGRCEELMTLQICALRSVGLPARGVAVPWWSHTDNNHAWTEVLHPGGHWGLPGSSWEADSARQASVVVSRCYGAPVQDVEPEPGLDLEHGVEARLEEGLYTRQLKNVDLLSSSNEPGARWSQYNSIANYRQPARLRLDVSDSQPRNTLPWLEFYTGGGHVYIYVYNYGALRPVARLNLGTILAGVEYKRGVDVRLGAGTYALSCDAKGVDGVRLVTLTGTETLDVKWEDLPLLGDDTLLVYPKGEAPMEEGAEG